MPRDSLSLPSRLFLRFLLTLLLVWALSVYLWESFRLEGGLTAIVTVGALLTLMNVFVRPLLRLFAFPVKLVATLLAFVLVNGIFLLLVLRIVSAMDDTIVTLSIDRSIGGWITVMLALGAGNAVIGWMVRD